MPTTTNRGLEVPTHGSEVDTWDEPLNENFGLLDTIVGGIANIATTGGNTVLSAAQAACGTISITGTLTANATIQFPSVQGWWSIENLTVPGAFAVYALGSSQFIGIPPGEITDIQINAGVAKYRNFGRVGSYMDLATATVPGWITLSTVPPYLLCDGSTFSAATYPALAAILGTTTLPDARGSVFATLNQGTGRITTAGSGIDGDTRFSRGGAQTVTLATADIPAHTHANSLSDPGHFHNVNAMNGTGGVFVASGGGYTYLGDNQTTTKLTGITLTNASAGGGGAHNNMPPTLITGIRLIRAA